MSRGPSLRGVLLNPRERRLRAGWRLVATTGLLAVALVVSVPLVGAVAGSGGITPGSLAGAGVFVLPTVTLVVAARAIDRRSVDDLGLAPDRDWWTDLLAGSAIGFCLPAAVFGTEYSLGFLRITAVLGSGTAAPVPSGPPLWAAVALAFAYFLGVGVFEELLFRGYLLTNLAEGVAGMGPLSDVAAAAAATGATSLLFGLAHGLNPNAAPLAVVLISGYGGLLAAGYLLTGRLALPVGIHTVWNFAVASVFGFPVSGFDAGVSVLAVEQSGPALVTGGSFGPEGGLVSLPALAIGTALLLAWVRWREGRIRVHPDIARPPARPDERDGG